MTRATLRPQFGDPDPVPYGKRITSTPVCKIEGFSSFLKDTTSMHKVKLCAWGTPCRRHLCDRCACERSKDLRDEWLSHIEDSDASLFVRLSVESSHDLNVGWSNLALTRSQFIKRYRLSTISRSWLRSTELTLNRGLWNWHDNFVILGTQDQLDHIDATIAERWARAATKVGVNAAVGAQYVKRARNTEDVVGYVHKGLLGLSRDPERGRTPGDILLGHFRGDADDAERRYELETFLSARPKAPTLTQRGGAFRGL